MLRTTVGLAELGALAASRNAPAAALAVSRSMSIEQNLTDKRKVEEERYMRERDKAALNAYEKKKKEQEAAAHDKAAQEEKGHVITADPPEHPPSKP